MERQRRCGWLPEAEVAAAHGVWAREQVVLATCPVSYISAESARLLEEFNAWKLLGAAGIHDLPARTAEAFCLLESELRLEH